MNKQIDLTKAVQFELIQIAHRESNRASSLVSIVSVILFLLSLMTVGCSSAPKKGFELPPALHEVFRGGELKGLENAETPDLGNPTLYSLQQHVCVSTPIFNIEGAYVRTDVRCY